MWVARPTAWSPRFVRSFQEYRRKDHVERTVQLSEVSLDECLNLKNPKRSTWRSRYLQRNLVTDDSAEQYLRKRSSQRYQAVCNVSRTWRDADSLHLVRLRHVDITNERINSDFDIVSTIKQYPIHSLAISFP